MDKHDTGKRKRNVVRSPSYPSIDLEAAIGLAEIIKTKEGGGIHFVPYQSVVSHWGYKPNSGAGGLKIAALKKFGLIEDKGTGNKREVKLTDLAKKILFYRDDNENQNIYREALQEAALSPLIHQELWSKWEGELPSDQTIKAYLLFQRPGGKFAETSVDGFIRQFRITISFASLQKDDIMFGHDEDKITNQQIGTDMESTPKPQPRNPVRSYVEQPYGDAEVDVIEIPIVFPVSGKTGNIMIPKSLTNDEWNQMSGILNAYKKILVLDNKESEKQNNNEPEQ